MIAEVLKDLEQMGDLTRFVIDDLTPAEKDEFFTILEDARDLRTWCVRTGHGAPC